MNFGFYYHHENSPDGVDLLQDASNGVLGGEFVPPEAAQHALQPLWCRHDTIITHQPPQQPSRHLLCLRPRHERPERRRIEVNHAPATPARANNQGTFSLVLARAACAFPASSADADQSSCSALQPRPFLVQYVEVHIGCCCLF